MSFDTVVFGLPLSALLTALGYGIAAAVIVRFVLGVVIGQIRKIAARTETDLDDLAVELMEKTRFLFILLVGVWFGARSIGLPEQWDSALTHILVGVLLLQVGLWGMGLIDYLVQHFTRRRMEDDPGFATAMGAVGFIARVLLWSVILLTGLATFGIDITAFVASLGIGGLAVALALQDVFGDLLASLSIIFDKPFVIGDFVTIGEMSGTVESVGLKTTRVKALSGEQLVFSNADLLTSRIRNYGRMEERRVAFLLGVEYGVPKSKLEAIPGMVQAAVEAQANARFDRCHFKSFGDFSLNYETVYFMSVPDYAAYMDTQQAINLEIYEAFEREEIPFAFPTQTLHLVRGDGAEPGV